MRYIFYDYETSGTKEKYDQVFQFAAIICDASLQKIEEHNIYCRPRNDIIPHPKAILKNKLNIEECVEKGISEISFADKINNLFTEKDHSYIIGYNSSNFDDKFTEYLFYRNLIDPFKWGYYNNNLKLDLYKIVVAAYGSKNLINIRFPIVKNKLSLKLEDLANKNNFKPLGSHDALVDSKHSLQLFEQIFKNEYFLKHMLSCADKNKLRSKTNDGIFINLSQFNGAENNYFSVHKKIINHPKFKNQIISWNLKYDPLEILQYSPDQIAENWYAPKEKKKFEVGFETINFSRFPAIFSTDIDDLETGWNIRTEITEQNLQILTKNFEKIQNLAKESSLKDSEKFEKKVNIDFDGRLYEDSFFTETPYCHEIIDEFKEKKHKFDLSKVENERYFELILKLKGRHFYSYLNNYERRLYNQFRRQKFFSNEENNYCTFYNFNSVMEEIFLTEKLSEAQKKCLSILNKYVNQLVDEVNY